MNMLGFTAFSESKRLTMYMPQTNAATSMEAAL